MDEGCPTFYGKYRGTVENEVDPQGMGRIQVSVPSVLGEGRLAWAMPCMPYAGAGVGFFAVPPRKAHVWVEFEAGDPDYPIWSGCFWALSENPVPPGPTNAMTAALVTDKGKVLLDNNPVLPSLLVEMKVGGAGDTAKIEANPTSMTISWGKNKIELGPDGVSINNPNLKILP